MKHMNNIHEEKGLLGLAIEVQSWIMDPERGACYCSLAHY